MKEVALPNSPAANPSSPRDNAPDTHDHLMGINHCCLREERQSNEYYWENWRREDKPTVVLQRTLSGSGIYEDQAGRHEVPQGHAFVAVIPEPSRYFYPPEANEPWVFSWINFRGTLATALWITLRETFGPVIALPDRSPATLALNQLISRFETRAFRDPLEVSAMVYSFYLECWRGLMQGEIDPETRLYLVLKHCRDHLREGLTVKEVAARAEMSREHFTREFRRLFGVPPATYLRDQRLSDAENLLANSHLTVREISERAGFATPRQFGETFRRCRGISPQAFRESRRDCA